MTFWFTLIILFIFIRFILPGLLRTVLSGFVRQQVRKAQEQGGGAFGNPFGPMNGPASPPPPAAAPGQVRVDYVPPTPAQASKAGSFKGGEYVDFEEVK